MLLRYIIRIIIFVILFTILPLPAYAANPDKTLKVGVSPFTPFVISSGNEQKGFSVDLWNAIAQQLEIEYEFIWSPAVVEKLQNLSNGRTDVAIGGITITEDRETQVDFCHSHFHTGLDILTLSAPQTSLLVLISSFFTRTKLLVIAAFCLLIVIAGHIIWFIERHTHKDTKTFHRDYFPGVFEGMYWAVVTASTVGYGDKVPRRWAGRIFAPQYYGFAVQEGSRWREKINRTLLDLIESGDYQRIYANWFGE